MSLRKSQRIQERLCKSEQKRKASTHLEDVEKPVYKTARKAAKSVICEQRVTTPVHCLINAGESTMASAGTTSLGKQLEKINLESAGKEKDGRLATLVSMITQDCDVQKLVEFVSVDQMLLTKAIHLAAKHCRSQHLFFLLARCNVARADRQSALEALLDNNSNASTQGRICCELLCANSEIKQEMLQRASTQYRAILSNIVCKT